MLCKKKKKLSKERYIDIVIEKDNYIKFHKN